MRDFEPLASLNFTEMTMMVKNGLPAATLPEFIQHAKANPGKLNYASSGNGGRCREHHQQRCDCHAIHIGRLVAPRQSTDIFSCGLFRASPG
jgi:hypothetical protein